eukprot:CAMPEP_0174932652 /NCGR_PEP_ID=MMETSP1355-20121228/39250_1 /TAXON_ID=464990 /ORGANISM="Hemiselmis tepida, Strain CCMP443" /LENGTH=159 /DNA_ID=CAMNT_0016179085 /DNA_START=33 /DNA_END=509 /DNA_ORIENTATION=-
MADKEAHFTAFDGFTGSVLQVDLPLSASVADLKNALNPRGAGAALMLCQDAASNRPPVALDDDREKVGSTCLLHESLEVFVFFHDREEEPPAPSFWGGTSSSPNARSGDRLEAQSPLQMSVDSEAGPGDALVACLADKARKLQRLGAQAALIAEEGEAR